MVTTDEKYTSEGINTTEQGFCVQLEILKILKKIEVNTRK